MATDNVTIDMDGIAQDTQAAQGLDANMLAQLLGPRQPSPRLPRFLPFDVDLWKNQCEAAFTIHGLNDEKQKYLHVLSSLEPESIKQVTSYITNPHPNAEFSGLVTALKLAFSITDGEKMEKIFGMTLGDKRPSQLYYDMRRMWLDKDPDESKVLRHLFIKKLPQAVAVLLRSITTIDLLEFLGAADNMVDQYHQSDNWSAARHVQLPKDEGSNEMGYPSSVDKTYKFQKQNSKAMQEKPREPRFNEDGICNYHSKWGNRAFKCRPGCKYISKSCSCVNSIIHDTDSTDTITLPSTWNQHRAVRLKQKVDDKNLLVDTGTHYSLLPARSHELQRKGNYKLFKGAQGAPIPVYGQRTIFVDIGTGRKFKHTFFVGGVEDPLLGLDFLLEHRLAVDPVHERLIDIDTFATVPASRILVNSITSMEPSNGDFHNLWKEFPTICQASIEKLLSQPTHSVEHDIILKPGSRPANAKVRRLFGDKLTAAKKEFETMLKLGIIEHSKSEWASPLHVVPKGKDSFRPCGDFRQLNSYTIPDMYPVPHIQDFSAHLQNSKIFSKIDLIRAFHQIPLSKEAIPKTAVITPFGLYQFKRMPFGLRNAAQTFQRFMNTITRGLEGVYVYIDDILVASENKLDHEKHLRKLFSRLSENGLVVNPSKSVLGTKEVDFLGFHVNTEGVKPQEDKVKAIREFKTPETYGQLSEFLGMMNFYHRFIPRCSQLARPLYEVLKSHNTKSNSKKSIPISQWGKQQDQAYENLKDALAKVTTLSFPNHDAYTRLVSDASETAAGAVLEQNIDNSWKPIAFYSKAFKGAELSYSTYDRELLAIKLALRHFRHIVEGIPASNFYVATDHKPLTTGKNFTCMNSNKTQLNRTQRTWQFISELTTDIRYIAGNDNSVADALSRKPVNATNNFSLLELISKEQERVNMRPHKDEPWPVHWEVQKHYDIELTVDVRSGTPRPVVPDSLAKHVFQSIHNTSHNGVKATKKQISLSYVWPNMSKQIKEWIAQCQSCQRAKITKHNKAPYQAFDCPTAKFDIVHIDIVGPFPENEGYSYVLTAIDRFSRWPVAIPMKGITSKDCCKAFINGWIQYYGTPSVIISDRGRQFISCLWEELCNMLGSTHKMTTSYHPQSNGMVERFHRQLKASLMAKLDSNEAWVDVLPIIMLGIRNAAKQDLGVSAAQIMYGQPLRLPNAFFPDQMSKQDLSNQNNVHEYVSHLQDTMAAYKYTRPSWHGNENAKGTISKLLQTCSEVFVLQPGLKPSLQCPYKGPFKVINRNNKVFTISLPNGHTETVSIDRLKPATLLDMEE